jgi:hypothetical protein
MILAPQYYGTNSILVMQASKEASIQEEEEEDLVI